MSRRPTVLLADDHPVFTDGLASLLKGDFDVVASVRDGAQMIESARRLRPDVVVADISMPQISGLEALRQLKRHGIESRVIILTMLADRRLAADALREGASGFLLKESSGEEVVNAIREVLAGRIYLSPAVTREVLAMMSAPADATTVRLTVRQREILRLIVEGRRIKEIAAALDLAPRTAETLKYELMRTLNVHSTAELVRYALERRLVHTEATSRPERLDESER